MDKRILNRIARELLAGGIPRSQVRRYPGELEDHHASLVEANLCNGANPEAALRLADRVLGKEEGLVQAMLSRKELHSWFGRFPVLVVFTPLLVFSAGLMLSIFFMIGVSETFRSGQEIIAGSLTANLLQVLRWALMHALAPLIAGAMLAYAIGNRLSIWLAVTGAFLVCLPASMMTIMLVVPAAPGGQGELGIAFGMHLMPALSLDNPWLRMLFTACVMSVPLFRYQQRCNKEFA